jgi:hypothetical protein
MSGTALWRVPANSGSGIALALAHRTVVIIDQPISFRAGEDVVVNGRLQPIQVLAK